MIRRLEGRTPIFERYIDPRAGKTAATALKERNQALIDILAEPTDEDEGMYFRPSVQTEIEEGLGIVNSMLAYNEEEPLSHINEPHLYISSDCKNLIWAMENWTGADRDKGACKDPIDTLRYLLMMDLMHIGKDSFKGHPGGSY